MRYIRFVVENREPLRIGDDETSQHGQTDTLHYIPGSAVRGMVVQALVQNPAAFEEDAGENEEEYEDPEEEPDE